MDSTLNTLRSSRPRRVCNRPSWRASGFAGPESILVTTVRSGPTSRDDPLRFSATDYTALVRIGDAMIVLRVGPWETGSPRRADVDRLIGAALTRATA